MRGFALRQTNRQTDICECRVAFSAEKLVHIYLYLVYDIMSHTMRYSALDFGCRHRHLNWHSRQEYSALYRIFPWSWRIDRFCPGFSIDSIVGLADGNLSKLEFVFEIFATMRSTYLLTSIEQYRIARIGCKYTLSDWNILGLQIGKEDKELFNKYLPFLVSPEERVSTAASSFFESIFTVNSIAFHQSVWMSWLIFNVNIEEEGTC